MDYLHNPELHIPKSLKLLKIHKRIYLGGVNEGILIDHFRSLKHGLEFLEFFFQLSRNEDLLQRIAYSVFNVKQKLYSFTYHGKDGSLLMNLEHAYADLREDIKNVVMKPGTNEYNVVFPKPLSKISVFLCKKIKKLMASSDDFKADQNTLCRKELEDIWRMLIFLEPFFEYTGNGHGYIGTKVENEEEKKMLANVTAVLDRAACFIYLSIVAKMDDELVLSLKNRLLLSPIIIEETQIMKMYLILRIDPTGSLQPHISMSLRLLEWNKKCYLGTEIGVTMEDHFMSIEHGLQFLDKFLEISRDRHLKLRISHLLDIVNQKLSSLPLNQKDENLILVNKEHAYGELREEMQNVVIMPEIGDRHTLFLKFLQGDHCLRSIHDVMRNSNSTKLIDFLLEKIMKLVTSSCKAAHIAPMMKEFEEIKKKLKSLNPLVDYVIELRYEDRKLDLLMAFLHTATCLIYFAFVGKLNEDMLVLLRKNLTLLFEETHVQDMLLRAGIIFEHDLESDIDISLSLLRRQEEYYKGTTNEALLEDPIISLKHGIEILKWIPKIQIDKSCEYYITELANDIKRKLESLKVDIDGSLSMDVKCRYVDLREEMENFVIDQSTRESKNSFPKNITVNAYLRSNNDILLEKITALVTLNCKADLIAPLKKELKDLRKILAMLKPLSLYIYREMKLLDSGDHIFITLLNVHRKAMYLICLCFVGEMDKEMVLSVKSAISTINEETHVLKMYTGVLSEVLSERRYLENELILLDNLILVLKCSAEYFNDASSKLYEVFLLTHSFLLGLSQQVLRRKRNIVQPSIQAILGHSIPIVCSCYFEDAEVDISAELNCVLILIEHIKSESQEMKLYYFPRVDDLGFLEIFSVYLDDLLKKQEISMKEEIDSLHFEVNSLLSLAKVIKEEELNGTRWTDIINLAYQAEYIIDLQLVNSCTDTGLILSLSKIIEQLKSIRTNDVYGLGRKSFLVHSESQSVLGTTTQISDNDEIIGYEKEASVISKCLLKGENKLDIISIVGMPGIGKTHLASTLYRTSSMADHFDILAWCTVSQSYQKKNVLLTLLDQVNPSQKNQKTRSNDQDLADNLCRSLKKRRYFIVLDDIWDNTLLSYLIRYLPKTEASRILITARNRDVNAEKIGGKVYENVYQLNGLSKENGMDLFQKKLVGKEDLSGSFLELSKGIVDHCKKVPLSIVIIAGILRDTERTEKKWNQIAETVSSCVLSDAQGNCKAIIELSYNQLPNYLRSCFLYLGIFPEDQEILVNRLILLWVAEGFVQDTKTARAENVAKKYIKDLISKSLVIPIKGTSRGGVKTFRLHDLMRNFCLDKANEKHLFTLLDKRNLPLKDPRRLIIYGGSKGLKLSYHSVRSMISFDEVEYFDIEKVIQSYDMVIIKVLEVSKELYPPFPDVSSLVHLTYLGLRLWDKSIPSSISKLENLQILILLCGDDVMEVPDSIWDMVKLRHVSIRTGALFQIDSTRLQNSSSLLENLRYLSKAHVSCNDSEWLCKLSGLERLSCIYTRDDDSECNQSEKLSFNDHLTSLKVENASTHRFATSCQLPNNLQKLTLSKVFLKSNDISEIGRTVPHLEVFKIYNCGVFPKFKWNVVGKDFPKLKVLKMSDLNISKWIATGDSFPNLEQLWVEYCDYLEEIPIEFGSPLCLQLITVRECASSVDTSATRIKELQHKQNNKKMKVRIYPKYGFY